MKSIRSRSHSDRLPMAGQVALVTGASGGIGSVVAERLLAAGASVALHFRSNPEEARRIAKRYGAQRTLLVRADFATRFGAAAFFDRIWRWRRRVDIVVHSAARIVPGKPLDAVTERDLALMWRVNFLAPFQLSQQAMKRMRQQGGGRIVSVSSIGVKFGGSPTTTAYMVSKAALEAGMHALAKAGARDGILVNVVRAGVTRTAAHQRMKRRDLAAREAMIPMGRAADPGEIAEVVCFLVSPSNSYMTNTVLPVAGGE